MSDLSFDIHLKIPDLWQQRAIAALQRGRDVIVDAPTGAGKTFVFELLVDSGFRGRAVYTVPTRALANDKLLEWRAKGWNVGIVTGDVTENVDAPVIVATLETQKQRFIRGLGPALLVVDEYQMLGDPGRGVNYELAMALAPPETQLLLLSGSVGNPEDVADWLRRLDRDVELVSHAVRPVPLEEIHLEGLPGRVPDRIQGFWPRLLAKALLNDMGPVLVFAPRRRSAEALAAKLAAALPEDSPLALSGEQRRVAGAQLAKLLKTRIAYHHSGLSYQQRAGVVEPLAKAGQLRIVVATTGLGAGVNFSLRSVLVTDREYRSNERYDMVRPDELLQMFGRAGRRGLDERGYILVAPDKPRRSEARPLHLRRSSRIDWPSMLAVMRAAVDAREDPRQAAIRVAGRLFSQERPLLGLKDLLAMGPQTEEKKELAKRANTVVEIQNGDGGWERRKAPVRRRFGDALFFDKGEWKPAEACPPAFETLRPEAGRLCKVAEPGGGDGSPQYGRLMPLAILPEKREEGELKLTRNLVRHLRDREPEQGGWRGRLRKTGWTLDRLERDIVPRLGELTDGGTVSELVEQNGTISAKLAFSDAPVFAFVDGEGRTLLNPPQREVEKSGIASFREAFGQPEEERKGGTMNLAKVWLKLGLIDHHAEPTRRGIIFSFFNQGEGLAVAAGLEDATYDVEALARDLANVRAGHRFSEFDGASSRLAYACRTLYGGASHPGYLEKGLPIDYGDGAAEVLAELRAHPEKRHQFHLEDLRFGDIERVGLEWRSLLNHILSAPDYEWERWMDLKAAAKSILGSQPKPELWSDFPELTRAQKTRYACGLGRC